MQCTIRTAERSNLIAQRFFLIGSQEEFYVQTEINSDLGRRQIPFSSLAKRIKVKDKIRLLIRNA